MADTSFVNTREFSRLISKPSTMTVFDMSMLEDLLNLYPYSYPLHVSYAYALNKFRPAEYENYIAKAAIYTPDRTLLHTIIHNVEEYEKLNTLAPTHTINILDNLADTSFSEDITRPDTDDSPIVAVDLSPILQTTEYPSINSDQSQKEPASSPIGSDDSSDTDEILHLSTEESSPGDQKSSNDATDLEPNSESEETLHFALENIPAEDNESLKSSNLRVEVSETSDAVETYVEPDSSEPEDFAEAPEIPSPLFENEPALNAVEQITYQEIDHDTPVLTEDTPVLEEELKVSESPAFENTIETVIPFSEYPEFDLSNDDEINREVKNQKDVSSMSPAQNEIVGNIASTDYFVFEKSAIDPLQKEDSGFTHIAKSLPPSQESSKEEVSRYDDDTMPYSFLWWLNKTRKEHASTFQPYASNDNASKQMPKASVNAQLDQQIIENIFHFQPEINVFREVTAEANTPSIRRKEDLLIEKFIVEDPQIRSPKADRLDTENKARKSSEDNLDMVSETLARIYTDQMLYHKAIDTYQKLSFKFPEKSTYFAGQIRELEKKFN